MNDREMSGAATRTGEEMNSSFRASVLCATAIIGCFTSAASLNGAAAGLEGRVVVAAQHGDVDPAVTVQHVAELGNEHLSKLAPDGADGGLAFGKGRALKRKHSQINSTLKAVKSTFFGDC